MRKKIIVGNWKMNNTQAETINLLTKLKSELKDTGDGCDVVICLPFVFLDYASKELKGTNISVGAQNVHFAQSGAYTGEISVSMLKDFGVSFVIIGHSERRCYFAETDETVNMKAKFAVENGLCPIICVGETLEQREAGKLVQVLENQTRCAVGGLDINRVIIAYEPIWAIGTGQTATPEDADQACGLIRNVIRDVYNDSAANDIRIQYGGSMNGSNASDLLSKSNIDGGLIGSASLKAEDFLKIIQAAYL